MLARLTPLLLVAIAACGTPPPRVPAEGEAARVRVDAATTAYAECVTAAAKRLAVPTTQAADAADAAFKECAPVRGALVAEVGRFHRIGSPNATADATTSIAEVSVSAIETDLRSSAVVTAVSTQLAQEKTP